MIREFRPMQLVQSRDVRPRYATPEEATVESWGRPVGMTVGKTVHLVLSLDLEYDEAHRELVARLLDAVRDLQAALGLCKRSSTGESG